MSNSSTAVAPGTDLSPLAWVQAELRRSLEAAHKALRRHVKEAQALGGSDVDVVDPAVLRGARAALHQGVGALELVGLLAPARLLRASEAAVQKMAARPALADAAAVETVERASFALLDYLGRLLAGKPVSALALFPQYRAVQALAGAERVHPADLWADGFTWHALPPDPRAVPRGADAAARESMESLVLAAMRSPDRALPRQLGELCAGLGAGVRGPQATVWQLASAFFEAQAAGWLPVDVYTKRIASRLLAQLRDAVAGREDLSERLAADLLFFCAHAERRARAALGDAPLAAHAPRLAAVLDRWQPDTAAAADYEASQLGRFDPAWVAQARKRVAAAKDAWSAVAGGELHRLPGLSEQFHLVGDSLRRLFPAGAELAAALQAAADRTAAASSAPAPAEAMEVATALLYVDACLEDGDFDGAALAERVQRLAARIDAVAAGHGAAALEPWMEELYRRVSDRQTMGSVVHELRAALSEVEKQVDPYFRDPSRRELLIPVPAQLGAMRGVLSVLGMEQASQAVLHMRDEIDALAQTEVDAQHAQRSGTFDRLAHNLGGLSFLIDMLSVQPVLAKSLFAWDPQAGRLDAVLRRTDEAVADTADGGAGDAGGSDALQAGAAPGPAAPSVAPAVAPSAAPAFAPLVAPSAAPSAAGAAAPPATSAASPAPGVDSDLEDDAEMRGIFIEEAREVATHAVASLARLDTQPEDASEMTALRRAFHTLKGSARMVGLRDFGEAAWACEQLYNARLAAAPRMDAPLRAFTEDALHHLADWTEAIAEGRDGGHRPEPVAAAAEALRLHGRLQPIAAAPAAAPAGAPADAASQALLARVPDLPSADDLVLDFGEPAPADAPLPLPAAAPADAPMFELDLAGLDDAPVGTGSAADAGAEGELPALPDLLELPELPALRDLQAPQDRPAVPDAQDVRDLPTGPDLSLPAPSPPDLPDLDLATRSAPLDAPPPPSTRAPAPADTFEPAFELRLDGDPLPAAAPADVETAQALQARELDLSELDLSDLDFGPAFGTPAADAPSARGAAAGPEEGDGAGAAVGDIAGEVAAEIPAQFAAGFADGAAHDVAADIAGEDAGQGAGEGVGNGVDAGAPGQADVPAAPVDEAVKVVGPLRIGLPLFNIFLNEADEQSRRLATELAEWELECGRHAVGEPAVAAAHSLAGSSATVGHVELSGLARALEHALERSRGAGPGQPGDAALFGEAADEIRRLLHQFAAGFLQPAQPGLHERLQAFVPAAPSVAPALPGAAGAATPGDAPGLPAAHPPTDDAVPLEAIVDELDTELLPVFEEEADELLPQLLGRLREWAARPEDDGAPAAVLRTLHTFKGGARLAGAMRLGEMAHRLESAVERLAAAGVPPAGAVEPLLARADAMASALEDLRPALRAASTAVAAAAADAGAEAAATSALPASPPGPSPSAAAPVADAPAGAAPAARPAPPPIDWSRFAPLPEEAPVPAAPAPADRAAGGAAGSGVVRVRGALLDRLVNQAGEVSITRARIDADVRQLQGSLNELTDSLERMRRQLRDIELQAETQIATRLEAAKAAAEAFDPLEMDRFTRFQELTRFMAESVNDVATLQRSLQRTLQSTEDQLAAQARLTRELQDDLLRTRMVEFDSLADRLHRVVRQAAKDSGKAARLVIQGGAIEVDRGVLERMVGPFEHLLRNAVAHGIEPPALREAAGKDATGTVTVGVTQEGNEVAVDVRDDGAGLDLARIRARAVARGLLPAPSQGGAAGDPSDEVVAQTIFAPGFSTAEQVTELAGRGVGLDVVRAEVDAMGGRIHTDSAPGRGTSMRLLLPLTTAVTQVVMLRCGELSVAVPSTLVELVRRVPADELEPAYAGGQLAIGETQLPFWWLGGLLGGAPRGDTSASRTAAVVVVRSAAQRVALHVDEVLGNQEVVVKNVGPQLSRLPGLAGVTLLASGAVALIYNPVALATAQGAGAREAARAGAPAVADRAAAAQALQRAPLVLVVDDSLTVRRVTQRLLAREGYRVAVAKDGLDALERLAQERPAVMLSDIEMPRMDGFDLLRNVRADPALAGLPVVVITSRTAQKHRDHARALGADHYLGKPYAEEELLALVARHARAGAAA